MFLPVILVLELFRKLRVAHRKNAHQVWSKSDRFCTSYVPNTELNNVFCLVFVLFFVLFLLVWVVLVVVLVLLGVVLV